MAPRRKCLVRFSLAKHSLGRNKPCEAVRCHFQKVLIVFQEFIQETGCKTIFLWNFGKKSVETSKQLQKDLCIFRWHCVTDTEVRAKNKHKISMRPRESHGMAKSSLLKPLDLGPKMALGRKVGFSLKSVEVFLCKTFLGYQQAVRSCLIPFSEGSHRFWELIQEIS